MPKSSAVAPSEQSQWLFWWSSSGSPAGRLTKGEPIDFCWRVTSDLQVGWKLPNSCCWWIWRSADVFWYLRFWPHATRPCKDRKLPFQTSQVSVWQGNALWNVYRQPQQRVHPGVDSKDLWNQNPTPTTSAHSRLATDMHQDPEGRAANTQISSAMFDVLPCEWPDFRVWLRICSFCGQKISKKKAEHPTASPVRMRCMSCLARSLANKQLKIQS